jgi:hypothetical protein
LEQRLRDRLADNYDVYMTDTMDLSKTEILEAAGDISNVQAAYEYFSDEHVFNESEIEFLLKFKFPLQLISDKWGSQMRDVSYTVQSIFADQERMLQKNGYELMPDEPDPPPAAPEQPPRMTVANGEKPSVMDRIKQHTQEQRERHAAPKDAPDRKKSGPEL